MSPLFDFNKEKVGFLKPYFFLSLFLALTILFCTFAYFTYFKRPSFFNLTIIHQANLSGEIDPCGCLISPLGGLAYRASVIKDIKSKNENILFFDSGDLFFRTHTLTEYKPKTLKMFRKNVNALVEYMNYLKVDAATFGDDDLAAGYDFWLSKHMMLNYPIVAINAEDEKKHIKPYIIKKYAGIKLLITGIIDPYQVAPYLNTEKIKITDYDKKLNALIKKENADLVIVLSHSGKLSDRLHVMLVPKIDIILGGHSGYYYGDQTKDNTYIVYPGERGKYISQVNIKMTLDKKTNKYKKEYSSEFFEIDPNKIKPDKDMNEMLKKYM